MWIKISESEIINSKYIKAIELEKTYINFYEKTKKHQCDLSATESIYVRKPSYFIKYKTNESAQYYLQHLLACLNIGKNYCEIIDKQGESWN